MSYQSFIGMIVLAFSVTTKVSATAGGSCVLQDRASAAPDSGYTISGKIDGLHAGWVYLLHAEVVTGQAIDSVKADEEGRFVFTGKVAAPENCGLGIGGPGGTKDFRIFFFLENGTILIDAKKDSLLQAVVSGSPLQEEKRQYKAAERSAVDWDAYYAAHRAASSKKDKRLLDSLDQAQDGMYKRLRQLAGQYATAHPHSYIAAFELYFQYAYKPDIAELQGLYAGLGTEIQNSYYGQLLKGMIGKGLLTGIGQMAPDFTQAGIDGKPVALSSFKGRIVLVDFWASWCGPCRAENPAVVKVYRQYHSRGFEILGVSLDDKKDKWVEAIKKDGLDWKQVSDLKGWQNSVAVLYGVQGIPMNYLLDKDGKIIATGLGGADLEKKLAELAH